MRMIEFSFLILLIMSSSFVNSQIDVEYYDNGDKKREVNHEKNTITEWYDNGQVKSKHFKDANRFERLSRLPVKWHENGQLAYEVKILPGDTIAEIKYYSSGQLNCIFKNTFVDIPQQKQVNDDFETVYSKCYCENGQLVSEGVVNQKDDKVYKMEHYHCNGELLRKYSTWNDLYDGDYYIYDESGNLIEKAYYEKGDLKEFEEYNLQGEKIRHFIYTDDGFKI